MDIDAVLWTETDAEMGRVDEFRLENMESRLSRDVEED